MLPNSLSISSIASHSLANVISFQCANPLYFLSSTSFKDLAISTMVGSKTWSYSSVPLSIRAQMYPLTEHNRRTSIYTEASSSWRGIFYSLFLIFSPAGILTASMIISIFFSISSKRFKVCSVLWSWATSPRSRILFRNSSTISSTRSSLHPHPGDIEPNGKTELGLKLDLVLQYCTETYSRNEPSLPTKIRRRAFPAEATISIHTSDFTVRYFALRLSTHTPEKYVK